MNMTSYNNEVLRPILEKPVPSLQKALDIITQTDSTIYRTRTLKKLGAREEIGTSSTYPTKDKLGFQALTTENNSLSLASTEPSRQAQQVASLQPTIFLNNVFIPSGILVDANSNIFLSNEQSFNNFVTKLSPNGTFLGQAQTSNGFFDLNGRVYLASAPALGGILALRPDGQLLRINPNNLSVTSLFNIRNLNVDIRNIYDVSTGTVDGFGGLIQPQFSTYGDIAVRQNGNATELFIAGISQAQTFPFVLGIRIQNNTIQEAKVLMSTRVVTSSPSVRTTRGIAVNSQGTVLTSLSTEGANFSILDKLVSFNANFNPTDGIQAGERPRIVFNNIDFYSQGMTADAAGNFYAVTNSVGSAALGAAGEGVLITLPSTLNTITGVGTTGLISSSFRDVAVDPARQKAYVSVSTFSVGSPADDLVVTFPVSGLGGLPSGTPGNDRLQGTSGNDFLDGKAGNDELLGFAGNDTLIGGTGNDTLNGGVGSDRMVGSAGNDLYIVDNTGDSVIENLNEGIDTVNSSINYTLAANLENLTLTGTAAINSTGNGLNNTIAGNSANNLLRGNAGVDRLIGGSGNDILVGGAGNDILTGGNGRDRFTFNLPNERIDRITDFNPLDDTIAISASGFGGGLVAGAAITAAQLRIGASATTTSHRFIYNSSNGALFFDADGTGAIAQVQIASLNAGLLLASADIFVTA
jgi:Ca2+-binding RTX toxin-like protein